jgi:bacillithiol system protein YtxJ
MSIIDRLLGTFEETLHDDWHPLTEEKQLQEIVQTSYENGSECGTSSMAKHTLETGWDFQKEELDFYYLDLLAFRPISNKVAETFKVVHHSPQIIVIKDGEALYNTSHHNISVGTLRKALNLG